MESNNQMKSNVEQDARINRYLKGQMSPDEEKSFLVELQEDSSLKARAIAIARMIKSMERIGSTNDGKIINSLRSISEEKVSEVAKRSSMPIKSKASRILFIPKKSLIAFSAAASILICIFGGYRIYDNHQMTTLASEYLAYFPMSEYNRGPENSVGREIYMLYQHIEERSDLEGTIVYLERIWEESQDLTYNDYTEFSPEIGWLLANAYIMNNEKDKAIKLLTILETESDGGSAMAEKARELCEQVEKKKIF